MHASSFKSRLIHFSSYFPLSSLSHLTCHRMTQPSTPLCRGKPFVTVATLTSPLSLSSRISLLSDSPARLQCFTPNLILTNLSNYGETKVDHRKTTYLAQGTNLEISQGGKFLKKTYLEWEKHRPTILTQDNSIYK